MWYEACESLCDGVFGGLRERGCGLCETSDGWCECVCEEADCARFVVRGWALSCANVGETFEGLCKREHRVLWVLRRGSWCCALCEREYRVCVVRCCATSEWCEPSTKSRRVTNPSVVRSRGWCVAAFVLACARASLVRSMVVRVGEVVVRRRRKSVAGARLPASLAVLKT